MIQETYNIVSVVTICIGFALTIASLWFLARQIRIALRSRETDIFLRLYEVSTTEPLFSDFDVVWEIKSNEQLTEVQSASCLRVCLFFEMLGAVVFEKYMGTVLIEEYFGSLVTGCFEILRTYIEAERQKPYNDNFALNFERLAMRISNSSRISRPPGYHSAIPRPNHIPEQPQ